MCIENHPTDSRIKVSETDVVQTLTSRMGTGGMNVPLVAESEQKTFKKKGHAKFKGDGQGWEETDINQTIPSIMCHDSAHGGLVMQNVVGVDAYNQTTTGGGWQ